MKITTDEIVVKMLSASGIYSPFQSFFLQLSTLLSPLAPITNVSTRAAMVTHPVKYILVSQPTGSGFTPYLCIPGFPTILAVQGYLHLHGHSRIHSISMLSRMLSIVYPFFWVHSNLCFPDLPTFLNIPVAPYSLSYNASIPSPHLCISVSTVSRVSVSNYACQGSRSICSFHQKLYQTTSSNPSLAVCPGAAPLVQKWLPDQKYFLPLFRVMFGCSGQATTSINKVDKNFNSRVATCGQLDL